MRARSAASVDDSTLAFLLDWLTNVLWRAAARRGDLFQLTDRTVLVFRKYAPQIAALRQPILLITRAHDGSFPILIGYMRSYIGASREEATAFRRP